VHREFAFDFLADGVGPGLGAEDAHFQAARARIELGGAEAVEYRQHVARRDHDDVGGKIGDELHLPLGLPA
jgi:hypothetical protein